MGLGRWWLTHGPGSPGSIAKAMARAYRVSKSLHPQASQDELLLRTLRTRYSKSQMDDDVATGLVRSAEGKLAALTLAIIELEIPGKVEATRINAPEVYAEMISVVNEVIAKYALGG